MKRYALGVDLGGTNIAVGLVDEDHHIVDHLSRKTNLPRPEEAVEQSIAEICRELVARNGLSFEQDIRWIGIGTPGRDVYKRQASNKSSAEKRSSFNVFWSICPFLIMILGEPATNRDIV